MAPPAHNDFYGASRSTLRERPEETLRGALERILREAILAGALRAGAQIPSSRELAHELGVSRGVVSDAYGQLASQGFLIMRPRGAPRVAPAARSPARSNPPFAPAPPIAHDLAPTTPEVNLFPLSRWLAAMQRTARESGAAGLGYRETRGERVLRDALADHLGRTRGVIAEPEQVLITQGTAQGLDVLLRVLRARGSRRFAVEDPSHATQHERVRSTGLDLVPQGVDEDGVVVDGLDADAVLVTPAHQYPTGVVMSPHRRRELLAWARHRAGLIVEDDYDAEFRYDREPVRALQGLAPDHVAELGTVSKTLAPALRLGWLITPPDLVDEASEQKRLLDDFSPANNQMALAELLLRGEYDRHLRSARATYRVRRDRMIDALARELPEFEVTGAAAGLHVLLHLPATLDDRKIASEALRARMLVFALSPLFVRVPPERGLVLGYGAIHESAIDTAIRQLRRVIHAQLEV